MKSPLYAKAEEKQEQSERGGAIASRDHAGLSALGEKLNSGLSVRERMKAFQGVEAKLDTAGEKETSSEIPKRALSQAVVGGAKTAIGEEKLERPQVPLLAASALL